MPDTLSTCIKRVYEAFDKYNSLAGMKFCTYCHDADEVKTFIETPTSGLSLDLKLRLAWEAADHWANTETYKHFLPAILERTAPPNHVQSSSPDHLFSVLAHHDFRAWDQLEKKAVLDLLAAGIEELNYANDSYSIQWCMAALEFCKWCEETPQ